MHKLIHLLVQGAAHESSYETPGRSARSRQTNHLRLHLGRIKEDRDEALRAAHLFQHLHRQQHDTSWRAVKLGFYSGYLTQIIVG